MVEKARSAVISETAKGTLLSGAQRLAYCSGRATSNFRMLPQFLICGAQRCGTTSMYHALRQHPAVMRPVLRKGVHYFDTDYGRGMAWYRAHFPLNAAAQLRQRRLGSPAMTFESSPYYLFHPLAAQRIAADLPDARVLIMIRDPVERAYSAHAHELARGFETEPFERALELEDSRIAGEEQRLIADPTARSESHQHHAYVHRGVYIDQILRMVAAVGRDQVLVIDAEDFFTDPGSVWREVAEFLRLGDAATPTFGRYNERPRSAMPASVRRSLEQRFEHSDGRLASWWGRTPSWRR